MSPPDSHFLLGAMGWLELGLPLEADHELDRIAPELQHDPDVLEARWAVCAALPDWARGVTVADALIAADPERCSGWLHRAYALRRAPGGGLQPAWDALRPSVERFPKEALIRFNLACYAAQLGRLDEAWDWLQEAARVADDRERIKRMALADDDLAPIWQRILEM